MRGTSGSPHTARSTRTPCSARRRAARCLATASAPGTCAPATRRWPASTACPRSPSTRRRTTPTSTCRRARGTLGYVARTLPWKPSLTYRYASFSGDDPATPAREAFDAPLSSGLDEWVQGINFKKVVTNSNLNTHRIRLNLAPSERVNYTVDWFRLWADVPLATGETGYGDELDFAVRWSVSKRLYFLGVAGVAWPGEVLRAQTGGAAKSWVTVQASLFFFF
jgi:hypothetical protein